VGLRYQMPRIAGQEVFLGLGDSFQQERHRELAAQEEGGDIMDVESSGNGFSK
jgi:hypothetical protein